ncbi:MAG TPA: TrbC/VirB2 family protein [Thermoanaerobaculia bacterium]|nr:TrbC/VirB2 family protein [Thermoanaerobaculia bacterium]
MPRNTPVLAPLCLVLLWLAASPLFAATGGASMPWDQGFSTLADNLTGPVAKAAALIAMAITGYKWAFRTHEEGGSSLSKLLFAASCLFFGAQILSTFGLTGAVV